MAWEWSHTNEAYGNALNNLAAESREFLEEAYSEIAATETEYDVPLHDAITQLAEDTLILTIWEFASTQRLCDNGGHNAWVCPHGCHTVSFDDQGNHYEY